MVGRGCGRTEKGTKGTIGHWWVLVRLKLYKTDRKLKYIFVPFCVFDINLQEKVVVVPSGTTSILPPRGTTPGGYYGHTCRIFSKLRPPP